jgi:O6-methylguanine-DNA--protein-cysteine methyltransferase
LDDRRRMFLATLRGCELTSPQGWCDLVEVGSRIGLNEVESENRALALKRHGEVEFCSQHWNDIRTTAAAGREHAMTIFDQRHQQVTNQQNVVGNVYNAAGDINIGAVRTTDELVEQLERLQAVIAQARAAGELDDDVGADAQAQLAKAAEQVKLPQPDKGGILGRINAAKSLH